jgi:hypothetical protein
MDQFQGMLHGLVNWAREHLMREVLLLGDNKVDAPPLPPIVWETIEDHLMEDQPWWYFAKSQRNLWGFNKEWWLFGRVWQDPQLWRAFIRRSRLPQAGH